MRVFDILWINHDGEMMERVEAIDEADARAQIPGDYLYIAAIEEVTDSTRDEFVGQLEEWG